MTALGEEPPKEPMSLRLCNLYVSQRERERERKKERGGRREGEWDGYRNLVVLKYTVHQM